MAALDRSPSRFGAAWSAVGRRTDARHVLRARAPAVLALWGLAVAQPLLDLFGKNPEFFVVNDLSRLEIVVFALVVLLGGPLVLVAVQLVANAVSPAVGRAVHVGEVALLGTALGFVVLEQFGVEDTAIVVLVAAFVGVVVAYLERTSGRARSALRYLALTPVVFLVAFLGFSRSGELVTSPGSADVEPGSVGRPTTVVLVSLDEFPLASLLRADGTINEERFPNLARLAATSSWYQDATAVAPLTQVSVPATLTGRLPDSQDLPTARDHPRSIFSLLGEAYDQHVHEQVTDLCPTSVCADDRGVLDLGRLRTAVADAAAVYAQAAMPPSVREHLPAVDRSWGGFIADANSGSAGSVGEQAMLAADDPGVTAGGADPSCPDVELWCGGARLSELIGDIEPDGGAGDRPDLYAAHVTVPHSPWIRSPEGHQYAPRSLALGGVDLSGNWAVDDPWQLRQGFQRHLYQVGYVDTLVGRLIDRLEAADLWEDALVVVTADHGVAFQPGASLRAPEPETLHEIFNIPLFVKLPGQEEGVVRTDNALNVDVLPTIVDALDIETDWDFDGESLIEGRDHRLDKPALTAAGTITLPDGFEHVLAVARRNATYVPREDGWLGVAGVGAYGDLVGARARDLATAPSSGATWSADEADLLADWDPDADPEPLLLHGRLAQGSLPAPTEALVVVNGTVAGVAGGFDGDAQGSDFSALIVEALVEPGANEVSLLVPTAAGGRTFATVPLTS